jgi:hypothetical protein
LTTLQGLLHKHRITTKVEIGGILNDADSFPTVVGIDEDLDINSIGISAIDHSFP